MLCEIAGLSRSGYYNWVHSADKRAEKEAQDRADFELVLDAYSFRGYDKGAQGIYMRLLHMNPPAVSYTHLDVYKRQEYKCVLKKLLAEVIDQET